MSATLRGKIRTFLFPAVSTHWVGVLRIGLGLQVMLYSLTLQNDWRYLFSSKSGGLVNRHLGEAILDLRSPFIPRLDWLVAAGHRLGFHEDSTLFLVWLCLLAAGACLLLGFLCRPAAITAWLLYLCSAKSGNLFSYGVDNFTVIGLFYLVIAPLPDSWALDAKLDARRILNPNRLGFHLRVLQLHLCVIYFFGGITKAFGLGWWNGTSIWRALASPPFNYVPLHILTSMHVVLLLGGVLVCLLEAGYPIFIWPQQTRAIWLSGVVAMHLGIGLAMGLYLFSLIMIILNLAGFGADLDLSGMCARVGRVRRAAL